MDHQNQPQPREICCCQSWSWAKVIGVIQIILYVILLIQAILLLSLASYAYDKVSSEVPYTGTTDTSILSIFIVVGILSLLFSVAGIATGVLLIMGANQKNVQYLNMWIAFVMADYVLEIVKAVLLPEVIFSVIYIVLCTAMYGFGLLVVIILRSEIYNGVYEKNRNTIMMPMPIKV